MIKKALKYLLYRFFGKPLYSLVKGIYHPSDTMLKRLRFIGKFRVKTEDGQHFYLFNNAFHLENRIFWMGLDKYPWERMTRRIWARLCISSSTIFDIGANSGIYSVLAKVYNPNSLVLAFEPQPNVYNVLRRNNQVNGFDIVCEQAALSSKEGRMPFYNYGPDTFSTENTTAGSLNKDWVTRDQSSIMVDVQKLGTYIEENDIGGIDLMKIDVETLEYEVLLGYGKCLSIHLPILILEIQNRDIGKNLESLLDPDQYSYYNIDEEDGLVSVTELGSATKDLNYLVCPNSKLDEVRDFISS
ncbi:FkbM family methyltransferase [Bacteroidota bacterium]